VQERVLLHRASVIGRIFWDDLALKMNDSGDDLKNDGGEQTAQILTTLQDRELILRNPQSAFAGTSEYIFKHSVLRDVTYERLLKRLRKIYHLQVAKWLCSSSGERVGEYAARIAEHFEYGSCLPRLPTGIIVPPSKLKKPIFPKWHRGSTARL
jgi:predicted ATPase